MATTKRALYLITKGSVSCEIIVPLEMLRRAGVHVTLASVHTETTTVHREYDAVILPGGLDPSKIMASSDLVKQIVQQHHSAGKLVAFICAGPTVLAASGIAKGSRITSYPTVKSEFADYEYVEERVVIDKNIITSRAPGTTFPFAMAIIEYLLGKESADKLRRSSLID
ncbi:protein DJ-1 [Syncephalis plumigaleata]|nr:protein DJ-1 [Syncephalis plumigaleata]